MLLLVPVEDTSLRPCMTRAIGILRNLVVAITVLFLIGFGIGGIDVIPSTAPVYIDDEDRTYSALPCFPPSQMDTPGPLRLGTVKQAKELGFKPDPQCVNQGHHAKDGRSVSGQLLQKFGVLPTLRHWWDHCSVRNMSGTEAELRCNRWPLQ
jgi:hypothetical protein